MEDTKVPDVALQIDVDGDGDPDFSVPVNRKLVTTIVTLIVGLFGVVCQTVNF